MTNTFYTFSLDRDQELRLETWVSEQNARAVQAQKDNPPNVALALLESCWEEGYPYGGAIGGDLTYSFTPTSLGVVVHVTNSHTDETIDLTDYESW